MTLLMSCLTTSDAVVEDVRTCEEQLASYNLNVLEKIDQQQLPKYVLAIIGDSTKIADANIDLSLLLESEINKTGRVNIVDRKNMDSIFEEQNLVFQGLTDEGSIEIGELAGAEFLLVSNIVASSQQKEDEIIYEMMHVNVTVQAKLINVSTGEVYLSVDETGEVKEKLIVDADGYLVSGALDFNNLYKEATVNAVNSVVKKLIKNFPAIGFVLDNKNGVITSDLGTKAGATNGRKVALINRLGAVMHPITGKVSSYNYDYIGFGKVVTEGATSSKIEMIELNGTVDSSSVMILLD